MDPIYDDPIYISNQQAHWAAGIGSGALTTMSAGALILAFGVALMFPMRDIARHRNDTPMVSDDGIVPYARHDSLPPMGGSVFVKDDDHTYHWHRDCKLLYFKSLAGHHWKIRHQTRHEAELHGKQPCYYCEELDSMEAIGEGR